MKALVSIILIVIIFCSIQFKQVFLIPNEINSVSEFLLTILVLLAYSIVLGYIFVKKEAYFNISLLALGLSIIIFRDYGFWMMTLIIIAFLIASKLLKYLFDIWSDML